MQSDRTLYRRSFRPSEQLDHPYAMLGVNVFAADTDEEARLLFTSLQQAFINLQLGRTPGQLPPRQSQAAQTPASGPIDSRSWIELWRSRLVGSPETVRQGGWKSSSGRPVPTS